MKKLILFVFTIVATFNLTAQNQTINGILTVKDDIILKTGDLITTNYEEWGKKLYFGNTGDNGDHIYMGRYNRANNKSDLRICIGDDAEGDDRFVIGNYYWKDKTLWNDWFVVTNTKRVGIGVSYPTCALEVNGTIRSKEVKIEATGWSDFVFDENYALPTLSEVEAHIKQNKHLPDVPSEKQVLEEGVNVVEMQAKLLQKVEELTLYVIEQDKQIKELRKDKETLIEQVGKLEEAVKQLN